MLAGMRTSFRFVSMTNRPLRFSLCALLAALVIQFIHPDVRIHNPVGYGFNYLTGLLLAGMGLKAKSLTRFLQPIFGVAGLVALVFLVFILFMNPANDKEVSWRLWLLTGTLLASVVIQINQMLLTIRVLK